MKGGPDPDREIAGQMRLRGDPPVVARLSKRTLMLAAGSAATVIAALSGWALVDHRRGPTPRSVEERAPTRAPEQVADLPKDYLAPSDAPKLGPALPGDLGRPFLEAKTTPEIAAPAPGLSAEAQSALAEAQQARSSRIGVQVTAPAAGSMPVFEAPRPSAENSRTPGAELRPSPVPGSHVLQAGAVIPAALVTGIRSDVSGEVIAQVTEDVFDSVQGRYKLVPQGTRIIGAYGASPGFGQRRIALVWTRLLLPDGRSVALDREPAADPQGYAGLTDGVDRRWRALLGASLVSTLLGVGSQVGAGGGDPQLIQALRSGFASAANQTGQQIVGKTLDVQPTLTIRPGYPVRLLLTKDISLEAWP